MRRSRSASALLVSLSLAVAVLASCSAFSASDDLVASADAGGESEAATGVDGEPPDGARAATAKEATAPSVCPLVACNGATQPNACRDDDCDQDGGSLMCPSGIFPAPNGTCSVTTGPGGTCYLQKTLDEPDGGGRALVELAFKRVSTTIAPAGGLVALAEIYTTDDPAHFVGIGVEDGELRLCEVDGSDRSCKGGGPLPDPDDRIHVHGVISRQAPLETFTLRVGCMAQPIVLPLKKGFATGRLRAAVGCKSDVDVTCSASFDDVVFVSRAE